MSGTSDDWFDDGEAGWQAAAERRLEFSGLPPGPSLADDPLTRLWQDAEPSPETGAAAVAALRETRKRHEAEAAPKRRWRRG
jgi:hypothetical protein